MAENKSRDILFKIKAMCEAAIMAAFLADIAAEQAPAVAMEYDLIVKNHALSIKDECEYFK